MDLKRLRYFCVIVEQGTITGAARVLNISQPPLSRRVQELEEEVGVPLLVREGGGIRPTEAGRVLYQYGCDILRSVEEACSAARQAGSHTTQLVRIGISYLYQHYFSPLVAAFCQQGEGFRIETVIADSSSLEAMLAERRLDVALIQQPQRQEGYQCISLPPVAAVAVISRQLLAEPPAGPMPLAELGRLPLIVIRRIQGEGTFEQIANQLTQLGARPEVILSANEPRMVFDMLAQGIAAAALMPASEVPATAHAFCHVVALSPAPNLFFPTFVRLASAPQHAELVNILLRHSFVGDGEAEPSPAG
ncbi:LysR family transcriptional regulator [Nissabacter sp. SGAir0207]|uniref:LysR family transcriptional regulator n=1 Tax=Nissabacter sp. SGAir0207 TaxID=2126321 RepID=UPI0010CCC9AD|nr:LysR family transcriptional regulator [Nissabacter sp. SGAir0207]QCR36627.1 LysR family transcriptional regulator [Nissabacter sp. SGAir0207]